MEDSYPVLITWGLDQRYGDVYLDAFLDLTNENAAAHVKHIYTRAQFTNTNVALLHLPRGCEREDLAHYVECKEMKDEVLLKLNSAHVGIHDIVRKKHESGNVVDFIMGGKDGR